MNYSPISATALCALLAAGISPADAPAPKCEPVATEAVAATAATATTSAPTTAPADPAAVRILEQLEHTGRQHKTLRADLVQRVVYGGLGGEEERTGWVAYQSAVPADPVKKTPASPAKFRVQYLTLRQEGGRAIRDKVDYAFDGQWLTVAKHRIKQMTRYQWNAQGEERDLMRLGEGPFPMPFGQKADEVLEFFEVATRPLAKGEPAGTEFLLLTTRKARRKDISFRELKLWIDRKTHLPVRIVSRDAKRNVTTVEFKNARTGEAFDEAMFLLPGRGWQVKVERLE